MPEEFFKIIDYIALSQIIVFIVLIGKRKQIKFESRFFLIFFLVVIGLCLLDRIQFFYREFLDKHNFPYLYNSGDIFSLLYLPVFYFYIRSITSPEFKIRKRYLLHAIPSLLVFINLFLNYYIKPASVKYVLLKENMPFYKNIFQLQIFNWFHLLQLGYLFAGFLLVLMYQKKVKDYFSSYNRMQIPAIYLIILFVFFVRISNMTSFNIRHVTLINMDIFLSVYSVLIIFLGYLQPKIYLHQGDLKKLQTQKITDPGIQNQLMMIMQLEKPYFNPDLTLNDLAIQLGISERELSFVLNTELKVNFFNFVNKYRVEEAKQLLADKTNKKTILEILYQTGFNNKSAFNRVFKEFTGFTPTEFRKNNNKS